MNFRARFPVTIFAGNVVRSMMERLSTLGYRSTTVYLVGTVLTLSLVYYGFRTLKLFKENLAGGAWTYISVIAVFFGVGVVMFLVDAMLLVGLVVAVGIMQPVGAFFLFWDRGRTICSGRAKIISHRTNLPEFFFCTDYSISGKG